MTEVQRFVCFFSGVLSYDFFFMTTDWILIHRNLQNQLLNLGIVPNMIYRIKPCFSISARPERISFFLKRLRYCVSTSTITEG
jgi:hypothetical protein